MFDNPQQEVKNTSKKLRPIKMNDEDFELFYKEIYAEFGPKDIPPVELNPKKETVQEPVVEEVQEYVQEEAVYSHEAAEEPAPQEIPVTEADMAVQEEAAKAAARIRDVQDDEVIDSYTDGVKLVKPKKEKGVKGLVITICLECLAIAGIVAYWLLYIL